MRIALATETYWPDIIGAAMTLKQMFSALGANKATAVSLCEPQILRERPPHTERFQQLELPCALSERLANSPQALPASP